MTAIAFKVFNNILRQKNRVNNLNALLISQTNDKDCNIAMDMVIDELKMIENWERPLMAVYGARVLASKNEECNSMLLSLLNTVHQENWMIGIIKDLEGGTHITK